MKFVTTPTKRWQPTFLFATILLVGDSHTYQSFGHKLDALLRTLPQSEVATYASCGSSPYGWLTGSPTNCGYYEHDPDGKTVDLKTAPTPLIRDLLATLKPNLTIVVLGANLNGAPWEHSAQTVHQMAEMIAQSGSRCLWVGPPHARIHPDPKNSELYGILRGASTPYCQFIDSRALTRFPDQGGDGLHYDSLGAEGVRQMRKWAETISEVARKMHGP